MSVDKAGNTITQSHFAHVYADGDNVLFFIESLLFVISGTNTEYLKDQINYTAPYSGTNNSN